MKKTLTMTVLVEGNEEFSATAKLDASGPDYKSSRITWASQKGNESFKMANNSLNFYEAFGNLAMKADAYFGEKPYEIKTRICPEKPI